jgi:hypothetical protein
MYYDRDGNPISHDEWIRLWSNNAYKIIRRDTVGGYDVSTVWLGLDHGFGRGRPLIFETMVFEAEPTWHPASASFPGYWGRRDYDQRRYSTEADALAGHAAISEEIRLTSELSSNTAGPDGPSL